MANISVPSEVFPGFKIISELNESQIQAIAEYLSSLSNDSDFMKVTSELNSLLTIKNGKVLLQTFMSFNSLIEGDYELDTLAKDLTDSYLELSGEFFSAKRKNTLTSNLNVILNNYNSILEILETRKAYIENDNNLRDSNIHTDVRFIFKNDIDDKNRSGIIFHKLHLEYLKEDNFKELYLTLDLNDLNRLKSDIDKAIQKDQILRDNYKEMINFLF
ncbi:MAG: hypothetical protein ABI892_09040 [Flavobacterium sp.]